MEGLLEGLLGVLVELGLEIVVQGLFELGFHSLAAPFQSRPHPIFALIGYPLIGAALGGLSLLALPAHVIVDPALRLTALLCGPVFAGLTMAGIGALRRRRGQATLRLDSFGYGYLFALALELVRYFWGA